MNRLQKFAAAAAAAFALANPIAAVAGVIQPPPEQPLKIDVRTCGALMDTWIANNGSISSGSPTLTVGTQGWQRSAVKVGNPILVRGAGAAGADLITTISSASGGTLTLAATASTTVSGAFIEFGTDDSTAVNNCLNANGYANPWYSGTSSSFPTTIPGAWTEGVMQHGPKTVVIRSLGRNSSVLGVKAPIRMASGSRLEWDNAVVAALPGFSGEAVVSQIQNAGTATEVMEPRVVRPMLYGYGLANVGLMFEQATHPVIEGDSHFYGFNTSAIQLGSLSNSALRVILATFTGNIYIESPALGDGTTMATNNASGIGINIGWAYDSVFSGIHIMGYRTGFQDGPNAGNTVVNGTLHIWSDKVHGYNATAVNLQGGVGRFADIYVDTPSAPSGSPIGVNLSSGGYAIGSVRSTVNSSQGTVDNTVILINNTYQGNHSSYIGKVDASGASSAKYQAIFADTSKGNSLNVGSFGGDANYYSLGVTGVNPAGTVQAFGTATAGAVTLNAYRGQITTESLTTVAGADYVLTLTNAMIDSYNPAQVFVTIQNGSNSGGTPSVTRVATGNGTATIRVRNIDASAAFNGTLKIGFMVIP